MSGQDRVERRSADRVGDSSLLVVSGPSRTGHHFCENASIKDVSSGGISFVLKTPVDIGGELDLSIRSEQGSASEASLRFEIKARVLRVCRDRDLAGHFLVAARFEGKPVDLSVTQDYDALIRELQRAVEYDESRRHLFE
jgi:hypothetical protein